MPRNGTPAYQARRAARAKQTGKPGGAYPNRTDLGRAENQAVRTPPGLPYGQGKKLADMQRVQPLPQLSPVPAPPPGGAPTAQPGPGADTFQSTIAAAQSYPFPGLSLYGPSTRPEEHISTGLPVGPGPGPEILGNPTGGYVTSTLTRLAEVTGDQEMARLAQISAEQGL